MDPCNPNRDTPSTPRPPRAVAPQGLVLLNAPWVGGVIDDDRASRTIEGPLLLRVEHAGDPRRCTSLRVEAVGAAARDVARAGDAVTVDLPNVCLTPGFVNAHTHLDLTAIGPRQHDPDEGFVPWVGLVVRNRPTDEAAIRSSVRRGIELSLAAGVVAVGDIAGSVEGRASIEPFEELRSSPLAGVSFVEWFGFGVNEASAVTRLEGWADRHRDRLSTQGPVRLGLQPHAPYSAGLDLYRAARRVAAETGCPLSTHLAESADEAEFIAHGTGAFRALHERLGNLEPGTPTTGTGFGARRHPVDHLADVLSGGPPWLVAHANDAPDEAVHALARTGASVAYCPRSSAYFGAPGRFGPHRYRDLLGAGARVCLGTDSIVNLPPDAADPRSGVFGPLAEARVLAQRDGTDAGVLLDLITRGGARALGFDDGAFGFRTGGSVAGVVATVCGAGAASPSGGLHAALAGASPPALIYACRDAVVSSHDRCGFRARRRPA